MSYHSLFVLAQHLWAKLFAAETVLWAVTLKVDCRPAGPGKTQTGRSHVPHPRSMGHGRRKSAARAGVTEVVSRRARGPCSAPGPWPRHVLRVPRSPRRSRVARVAGDRIVERTGGGAGRASAAARGTRKKHTAPPRVDLRACGPSLSRRRNPCRARLGRLVVVASQPYTGTRTRTGAPQVPFRNRCSISGRLHTVMRHVYGCCSCNLPTTPWTTGKRAEACVLLDATMQAAWMAFASAANSGEGNEFF